MLIEKVAMFEERLSSLQWHDIGEIPTESPLLFGSTAWIVVFGHYSSCFDWQLITSTKLPRTKHPRRGAIIYMR